MLERLLHLVLRAHEALYERSDGRIGHGALGVPALLLRTTGRRTGRTRTNALIYAREGDRYLVVPSNGGAPRAPGWLHNLRAEPAVQIQIGRERQPVTAEFVAPDAPEFASLWRIVNDNNGGRYDTYQARTTRPIPIVALRPS